MKPGLQRLAIIVISLAILLVLAHQALRQPIHTADLPASFSRLDSYLEIEDRENAAMTMQEIKDKWNRVRMLILLNAGVDSLLMFESAMARLERAIEQKAFLEAQFDLVEMQVIWREFITF